jgi:hypothetical protein
MALPLIALAGCEDGVYRIEVGETAEEDELLEWVEDGAVERDRPLELAPPFAATRVLDVDAAGPTTVVLLERRPPLLVSHDAGATWTERGSGLPAGRAIALGDDPDRILYGARNRLYVSRDGGRFWRAVAVELPEILDVSWEP